ncbi:MAG: hypothetical protein KI790_18825 [Cyclobacteriaceae bacterium]|nr:hypothetical protein [Cyclobacteriaceae bacterium HetDA_MAG_MS6]
MKYAYLLILANAVWSCLPTNSEPQEIIKDAIEGHGAQLFDSKKVIFDFRGKQYSVWRESDQYIYTRSFTDSLGLVTDTLINSQTFTRHLNGQPIALTEEWSGKYANSVNSVLYFFQLPLLLRDVAVQKQYAGTTQIKGERYLGIKVTFVEEEGGKDFEDEYLYWFHEREKTLDYLAYNYQTDGGGVRFREAYNRREKGGILFQDYINYKPISKDTPLVELPKLFESGNLEELSRIVNEKIRVE